MEFQRIVYPTAPRADSMTESLTDSMTDSMSDSMSVGWLLKAVLTTSLHLNAIGELRHLQNAFGSIITTEGRDGEYFIASLMGYLSKSMEAVPNAYTQGVVHSLIAEHIGEPASEVIATNGTITTNGNIRANRAAFENVLGLSHTPREQVKMITVVAGRLAYRHSATEETDLQTVKEGVLALVLRDLAWLFAPGTRIPVAVEHLSHESHLNRCGCGIPYETVTTVRLHITEELQRMLTESLGGFPSAP